MKKFEEVFKINQEMLNKRDKSFADIKVNFNQVISSMNENKKQLKDDFIKYCEDEFQDKLDKKI